MHHHKFDQATRERLERFASAALTGILAHTYHPHQQDKYTTATIAFEYALAMLERADTFAPVADALNLEVKE